MCHTDPKVLWRKHWSGLKTVRLNLENYWAISYMNNDVILKTQAIKAITQEIY